MKLLCSVCNQLCTCEDDGNRFERTVTSSSGDEGKNFMIFTSFWLTLVCLRLGESMRCRTGSATGCKARTMLLFIMVTGAVIVG